MGALGMRGMQLLTILFAEHALTVQEKGVSNEEEPDGPHNNEACTLFLLNEANRCEQMIKTYLVGV